MKFRITSLLGAIALTVTLLSSSISNASDTGINLSLEGGGDYFAQTGITSYTFGVGGRVGYSVSPLMEVGFGYTFTNQTGGTFNTQLGTLKQTNDVSFFMLDVLHHFSGHPAAYFGVLFGLGLDNSTVGAPALSPQNPAKKVSGLSAGLTWGAVAGYDFALGGGMSFGPRVAALNELIVGSVTVVQTHLNLKYSF